MIIILILTLIIILEGESEDYKKTKSKAEKLSKYEFDWYINRIIPHLQKMIDAKEGKINVDYFKNILSKNTFLWISSCFSLKLPKSNGSISLFLSKIDESSFSK